MIDYSKILTYNFPGAEWVLNGDQYDGLEWLSNTPKPTKATLDNLWESTKAQIAAEIEAKAEAKAAVLARLGITEDEAKLLLA